MWRQQKKGSRFLTLYSSRFSVHKIEPVKWEAKSDRIDPCARTQLSPYFRDLLHLRHFPVCTPRVYLHSAQSMGTPGIRVLMQIYRVCSVSHPIPLTHPLVGIEYNRDEGPTTRPGYFFRWNFRSDNFFLLKDLRTICSKIIFHDHNDTRFYWISYIKLHDDFIHVECSGILRVLFVIISFVFFFLKHSFCWSPHYIFRSNQPLDAMKTASHDDSKTAVVDWIITGFQWRFFPLHEQWISVALRGQCLLDVGVGVADFVTRIQFVLWRLWWQLVCHCVTAFQVRPTPHFRV